MFLGGCKEINMQLAGKLKNIGINVIPGEKICLSCMIKLMSFKDDGQREPICSQVYEDEDNELNINELLKKNLNSSLTIMNISPLKMHAVNSHSRVALGKKKLLHVQKTVKLGIARTLNIDPEELSQEDSINKLSKEVKGKATDMDILIRKIKEKILISNRNQKIQLLTLVPISWSHKDIEKEFNVTNYMVQISRKLLQKNGILSFLEKKRGKKAPQESVDKIIEFYCNDENSRLMSGKKDFVSIARRSHMQKRLILSNLIELYAKFKTCYPDIKTCFANFCSHRPKWCITVGASGTHTIKNAPTIKMLS